MPSSFNFPHRTLLHKRIEDQWFDRSPKETQSTLTAIEAAEEAYHQRLNNITTPEVPPIVLGKIQHQNSVRQQHLRAQQQQQQQQQGLPGATEGGGGTPRNSNLHNPPRRSRVSSADTADLHSHASTHDPADDVSTVVNPNARNRGQYQQQQHPPQAQFQYAQPQQHSHEPPEPVMFWNRTRYRRSAGGDR